MKPLLIVALLGLIASTAIAQNTPVLTPDTDVGDGQRNGYTPPNGFVPDAKTAISIARAILIPIYGAKQIAAEEPLKATLKDDLWIVSGSLRRGRAGGVAEAHIRKSDCQVVLVIHGR